MDNLTNLESDILSALLKDYPFLGEHIPFLRVSSREFTGVGMYTNFLYIKNVEPLDIDNDALGIDEYITMEGLKDGLSFVLAITDNKINYLEVVANSESWDGSISKYAFKKLFFPSKSN
jgi:hypothetical protein